MFTTVVLAMLLIMMTPIMMMVLMSEFDYNDAVDDAVAANDWMIFEYVHQDDADYVDYGV